MKLAFLPAAIIAIALTSCSSTYRGAQTPDDVYYSPAREGVAEARTDNRRDRYQENLTYQDDRFLRMKVQNRDRWQAIDDYGYWYDSRYDYNVYSPDIRYRNAYALNNWYPSFGYTSYYNRNYFGYGGYYTPVYPVIYYKNPKVYTGVTGKSNLATYTNTRYNNSNTNYSKGYGSDNNFGNLVRKVFTNPGSDNTGNSGSYDRPARTFEPSTTPSSSAGGRSGGYNSTGTSTSTPRPPRN